MRLRVHPASMSPEEREATRALFAGSGAVHHDPGAGDGSSYYTRDAAGRFVLVTFRGKAVRPEWNYWFRSAAQRDAHIEQFKTRLQTLATHRESRRASQRTRHTLVPGDVLYTSWGYEQTNVEFYQVVAVRGSVVDVQELAQDRTESGIGMQGTAVPKPGVFLGDVLKGKRPNGSNQIRIDSCSTALPWSGKAIGWSSYA